MEYGTDDLDLIRSAIFGSEDTADVAFNLINFLGPETTDETEQDEMVNIGIEKVMKIENCSYEDAKKKLSSALNLAKEIIKRNNTIN